MGTGWGAGLRLGSVTSSAQPISTQMDHIMPWGNKSSRGAEVPTCKKRPALWARGRVACKAGLLGEKAMCRTWGRVFVFCTIKSATPRGTVIPNECATTLPAASLTAAYSTRSCHKKRCKKAATSPGSATFPSSRNGAREPSSCWPVLSKKVWAHSLRCCSNVLGKSSTSKAAPASSEEAME